MPLVLIENGQVACPKKGWTGMARDACCAEQARFGPGCGFGCPRGKAALEARREHRREEKREEAIRAKVREKHAAYYRRWGFLPSQTRAGRRQRQKAILAAARQKQRQTRRPEMPREPRPGGIDFSR